MPTYEYQCNACGHKMEEWQTITAPPLKKVPRVRQEQTAATPRHRRSHHLQRVRLLHHRLPERRLQKSSPKRFHRIIRRHQVRSERLLQPE